MPKQGCTDVDAARGHTCQTTAHVDGLTEPPVMMVFSRYSQLHTRNSYL